MTILVLFLLIISIGCEEPIESPKDESLSGLMVGSYKGTASGSQIITGSENNYIIKIKKIADTEIMMTANHLDSTMIFLSEKSDMSIHGENDRINLIFLPIGRDLNCSKEGFFIWSFQGFKFN